MEEGQLISIYDCQNILKLPEFTPEELIDKTFGASQTFKLTRQEFRELFKKSHPFVSRENPQLVNEALDRVFNLSDRNGDDLLDVDEFGKGLGVFTSRRLAQNTTRDLFYFLDKEFRSVINDRDVAEFLLSLTNSGFRDPNLNVDLKGLFGAIHKNNSSNKNNDTTYWQLYRHRNLDQVKQLEALLLASYAQGIGFQTAPKRWIPESNGNLERQQPPAQSINDLKSTTAPIVLQSLDDFVTLAHVTGLSSINSKELVKILKAQLTDVLSLTQDQFIRMFAEVFKGKYKNYNLFKEQLTAIFNFLDGNGNGVLDVEEIMHGFIHMGAGSERDKIEAAFMIIDRDGSGFVDYEELFYYFKQLFLMSVPNDEGLDPDRFEQEISELASATTTDVFKAVDVNGDEKVSLEEFIYWYEHDGGNPDAFDAAKKKSSERKKIADESQKPQKSINDLRRELDAQNAYTASIEEIRTIVPFDKINISLAIDVFKKEFDMESMPLPDFSKYLEKLFSLSGLTALDKRTIGQAATKVFTVIDNNGNGTLDINELGIGMSLICGGTPTEKIKAAFILHDRDNSNTLDFGEMLKYMETIFRLVGNNNESALLKKTKPEELAHLTSVQCFNQCGVPLEGAITYEQFRQWFVAS